MAANRFGVKIDKGLPYTFEIEMAVASGTTASIAAGSPTKMSSANAAAMVDGDGTTSQYFTGIAKDTSTETSSVAGVCQLWAPIPGLIYRATASVLANANTRAKIDALVHKRVKFDLSVLATNVWTVDTADADATANCVVIIDGQPLTSEIMFIYANKGSIDNVTT